MTPNQQHLKQLATAKKIAARYGADERACLAYLLSGHTRVQLQQLLKKDPASLTLDSALNAPPADIETALGDLPPSPQPAIDREDECPTAEFCPKNGEKITLYIDPRTNLPLIGVKNTYGDIARNMAAVIPYGALYRMDDTYITINISSDGTQYSTQEMTPERYCTWSEQWAVYNKYGSPRDTTRTNLSPAQANIIMASDQFRNTIPEIREISPIRLPIGAKDNQGQWNFCPAPIGYDASTKIYTIDSLPINWQANHQPRAIIKWLCAQFSDFPFDAGDCPLIARRSLGAMITAMLGQLLHHCCDRYPIICVNANQPGTGKSFMVRCILAPIHGEIGTTSFSNDDTELSKNLNAALFAGSRYIFLDDVKTLSSNALNRYVVSTIITDRELGKNKQFTKNNRIQFFTTGNNLKTTSDVERRTLPIDLFFPDDAPTRAYNSPISEHSILTPSWRKTALEALWGMVKAWQKDGCPRYVKKHNLSSFNAYVDIAANIAIHAGFADPFGARQVDLDTGDAVGTALRETITALADDITPATSHSLVDKDEQPLYDKQGNRMLWDGKHRGLYRNYTVADVKTKADSLGKLEILLSLVRGTGERAEAIGIGNLMRGIKGREWYDTRGRRYSVGSRKTSASNRYSFQILSEPTQDPSDDVDNPF